MFFSLLNINSDDIINLRWFYQTISKLGLNSGTTSYIICLYITTSSNGIKQFQSNQYFIIIIMLPTPCLNSSFCLNYIMTIRIHFSGNPILPGPFDILPGVLNIGPELSGYSILRDVPALGGTERPSTKTYRPAQKSWNPPNTIFI